MEIDVKKARVILNEAKSGGFMEGDIPESDDDIIKEAQYWYDEAYKAHEAGMQHETVNAILGIVTVDGYVEPPEDKETKIYRSSGGYSEQDLRGEVEIIPGTEDAVSEPHPKDGIVRIDDVVDLNVMKQNLPIPVVFDEDPEDFPRDISELTDKDVRRLSGEYNAYLSRAKWLLAIAVSDLASSTHLRDHAYRLSLKKVEKTDPKTEKTKLKEVIDAEARENEEFAKLDSAVLKHQHDVTIFKALVDIYSGNVDRLSREWTMRQDEYEKTR